MSEFRGGRCGRCGRCGAEAEARAQRVEDDDIIVRRRKAGPWEPVPSTTEQEKP